MSFQAPRSRAHFFAERRTIHSPSPSVARSTLAGLLLSALLLGAAFVGVGCGKKGDAGGHGGAPGGGGFEMPPMPVEVAEITPREVTERFEAVGTIEAGEAIVVVSEIDGLVRKLPFVEGGAVRQGELLAQLDDVELAAEAARSEAVRDQAKASFARVKSVVEQGAGSQQDLDDAAAALKVADANFAVAGSRLSKASIRAPWSGLVGARRVSPGAFIRAGDPITDLAQLDQVRVNFSAPERYLALLTRGAEVTVTTTAFLGEELKGKIDVVEPVLDQATRSTRIIARVANPGGRLRPGMSANVSAVLAQRQSALVVPAEAIFLEGNQALVYRVTDEGKVARTPVTLGIRLSDVVEVLSGLESGAKVVRAGHQKLFEGAKVMPVQSAGSAPAGGGAPGDAASGGAPAGEAPAGDQGAAQGGTR